MSYTPKNKIVDEDGNAFTNANPLPVEDVNAPQTDAITDAQLRATPVKVDDDETQAKLTTLIAAILPDNHQVAVSNEVEVTLNGEAVALDAATLAALETITALQGTSPWVVSGTVTATPSGTQDVNIVSGVQLEVTLNGEQVAISNFPAEYPLPAAQVTTLTPQTDALTDAELRASDVPVSLGQTYDSGNSTAHTAATQYVGTWFQTRSEGYVRQLTVLVGLDSSGNAGNTTLGGTFIFEYSEDGSTATISETREIDSFTDVRDFDLLNAGEYFRVKFTPSRSMTGSEAVIISTTQRRQNDGAFVRLANQEIEEQNAALPSVLAYAKNFNEFTGLSENVRADSYAPALESDTPLGIAGTFDSGIIDASAYNYVSTEMKSDVDGSLTVYFYDDAAGTTELRQFTRPYTGGEGFAIFGSILTRPYYRYVFTNGGTAQTDFWLATKFHKGALSGQILGLEDFIPSNVVVGVDRSVGVALTPDEVYENSRQSGIDSGNSTTTPLGIAGSFVGTTIDVSKYAGTSIYLKSDVDSASGGLKIIHVPDDETTADERTVSLFYDASALPQGIVYLIPASTAKFRVEYTNNGTTAQTQFVLEVKHTVTAFQTPILPLGVGVTDSSTAALVKSVGWLPDDAGTYAPIRRSEGTNAMEVAVKAHEVDTPIKSLGSFKVTRSSVTTTAAAVFTPDANCKSWTAKSITSGGKVVYVAESAAKATTGSGYPLQNQEWVGGDLASGTLYASCDSGSQAIAVFEVIE